MVFKDPLGKKDWF